MILKTLFDILLLILKIASYVSLIAVVACAVFVYKGGEINITYDRNEEDSPSDSIDDEGEV